MGHHSVQKKNSIGKNKDTKIFNLSNSFFKKENEHEKSEHKEFKNKLIFSYFISSDDDSCIDKSLECDGFANCKFKKDESSCATV